MNYKVYPTPDFKKVFKKLHKKYPSLKSDLQILIEKLAVDPKNGIHLGCGVFKIRMAINSKSKGKSGGARVITYVIHKNNEVFLIAIYDKDHLGNINREQIRNLLRKAGLLD